jgi:hypothetical protein
MRLLSVPIIIAVLIASTTVLAVGPNGNGNQVQPGPDGPGIGKEGTGNAPAPDKGEPSKPDKGEPPKPDKGEPPKPDKGEPPKPDKGEPPKPDNAILSPEGALATTDQNMALHAVETGDAIPLGEIVRKLKGRLGGRVIDAQLVTLGSRLVYRLTTMSDQGVSKRVVVDAKTGSILPEK